ncbi:hypothetical protein CHARACLAT_011510 [Characodon lateralis]|uniref:Mitochondrial mRNA-processing protein COX24 C-terminal domain-containing protein n=1 Tax=Characodon lateralis TaxID=208331 RepID=A0ABU7EBX2_9TELE|nr:hypothetical protein [Characodon lateralis]
MSFLRRVAGHSLRDRVRSSAIREGLCLSTGLGMPWAPPRRAERGVWGEGRLGISAESAAPATRSRMKQKMMTKMAEKKKGYREVKKQRKTDARKYIRKK